MKRKIISKVLVVIAVYSLFMLVFDVLQNPSVYNNTLGKISSNYQRNGDLKHYSIDKVNKPFIDIAENNAYNWDAVYYMSIRDKLYGEVDPHYADRYAFYPFFPMVWMVSGIRSHHIIFLNFLFYGIAVILLSQIFMKDKRNDIFFFILALLIPSVAVFYLPYAESLFVLTFAVGLFALVKKKYWLYFLAMICFSMTRPAVVILVFAFLGTDIMYLLRHRNIKHFFKQSTLTIAPVIMGWGIVTVIQYMYSGSWTSYFDTWILWPTESGLFNKITDWSTEGFGMNSFSIFFLTLPAVIYSIVWGIRSLLKSGKRETVSLFSGNETYIKEYMFNLSLLFIVGVLGYFICTSGNVINGFFRYTMAIPFFYIVLFQLPEKLEKVGVIYKLIALALSASALAWFMLNVHYAGNIFRFEYVGLYLFIFITPFIVFEKYLSDRAKMIVLLVYILPAIVWQTYLFNMYLSDAWIFT